MSKSLREELGVVVAGSESSSFNGFFETTTTKVSRRPEPGLVVGAEDVDVREGQPRGVDPTSPGSRSSGTHAALVAT